MWLQWKDVSEEELSMKHPKPDKEEFRKVILRKKIPSRVHLVELHIDTEVIRYFKEVFTEYARVAEDNGVRIAMENCPHISSYPISIGNIGYSPAVWELLFEAVPSESIGLEYDPSHLVWLGIDYLRGIYDFKERIYAVHAKDTEIVKSDLYKEGILGTNWWRYRLPGLGEINWQKFIGALYDIGYKGDIAIEHEDPVFSGDRMEEGLRLSLKHLKLFVL